MNNRIKQLRQSAQISQRDLASQIGVSTSTIGMYEQGRRDPDTKTLLDIAQFFNVSVDYLIGSSDIMDKFDVDSMAKGIAQNLIENPALMFSAECYTEQELTDLCDVIENSVKLALNARIKPNKNNNTDSN